MFACTTILCNPIRTVSKFNGKTFVVLLRSHKYGSYGVPEHSGPNEIVQMIPKHRCFQCNKANMVLMRLHNDSSSELPQHNSEL